MQFEGLFEKEGRGHLKYRAKGEKILKRLLFLSFVVSTLYSQTKAPSFELKGLDGKTYVIDSLILDAPVVVDFWATWCKSCGRALDELQKLWFEMGDSSFHLISINVDTPSKLSKVRSIVKAKGWKFPVLLDSSKKVKTLYKIIALPTLFIINRKGEIVYTRVGYNPKESKEVREVIEKIREESNEIR